MKKVFKMVNLTVASAMMTLALAGQGFAASATDFTDLNNVAAKDKIIALQQSGIISGMTETLFAPYASLTQAQSVQLLVSGLHLNLDAVRFKKEPKASDYFTNANDNAWYATALITAAVHNLSLPKDLDPNKIVTREQFTYQLVTAIESVGQLPMIKPVVVNVKDEDQINAEYSGAIQRALAYGMVKLNDEGKFSPKTDITREQAAEQLYNALQYLKAHAGPAVSGEMMTASEGVQLIADTLGIAGTDIKFKIDPDAKMTRESFVHLFIQTLQSSGRLPMINIQPVDIKDNDQIDIVNSGSIQLAITLGFVKLSDEGSFNPKSELTRTDAAEIANKVAQYLKAHPAPASSITYEEGVRMIKEGLALTGADIQIKIDPNAKMTREAFVSLLVQTLKSSGKLPMIKPAAVDIKDLEQVDTLNTGAIQLAVSLGIVKLSEEHLFNPKGELSYVDAADIVSQAVNVVKGFNNGN